MKISLLLNAFLSLIGLGETTTHYPVGILSSPDKSVADVEIPEVISQTRSPTLNGNGYVFFVPTPVAEEFLKKECCFGKRVIDVGVGFSNIPIKGIENGVSEYVANDISEDHLKILVKRTISALGEEKLSNLKMLCGRAPEVLTKLSGKYDAILADKVIHFFTPDEVKSFIGWAKSALTKKGRIYVTAVSIYSGLGRNDVYKKQYLQNLKDGKEFPGYFSDIMSKFEKSGAIPEKFKVPEQMILFSKADLEKVFQDNGMKVVYSCSLRMPEKENGKWETFEDEDYDNSGLVVGIIAEKL
ncbi:MAG: class I SAM-dependent methyltransferase [Holosporales bacterium]|jgi:precorrin-6B methylase 2|nr:class I SAM-dependent methyltransferase [Holosporales bacterium]